MVFCLPRMRDGTVQNGLHSFEWGVICQGLLKEFFTFLPPLKHPRGRRISSPWKGCLPPKIFLKIKDPSFTRKFGIYFAICADFGL